MTVPAPNDEPRPSRHTIARWLGRVGYATAQRMQDEVRSRLLAGIGSEELLLLEHDPVITLGRSASRGDVLAPGPWLAEREIEIVECDRGGRVTYHGPGQLVGYPIVDLDPDRRDIRRYVRDLQSVLILALAEIGVHAHPSEEADQIGVWVGRSKIASIGVHLRRWVTTHGFALNVTTDLSHFDAIIPCGLTDVRMTSVEHLTGERPDLATVAEAVVSSFADVFERSVTMDRAPETTQP